MHLEIREISKPNKPPLEFKGERVTIARIRKAEFLRETEEEKFEERERKRKKIENVARKMDEETKSFKDTTCRT